VCRVLEGCVRSGNLSKKRNGESIMSPAEYMIEAARTNADPKLAGDRVSSNPYMINLVHDSMGIAGEAGEFVDAVKRMMFYGRKPDITNMVEELGDLFWYMALACRTIEVSFEEVMEKNI